MKKIIAILITASAMLYLCGCRSAAIQLNAESTQPWEGRYSTQKEALDAISKATQLDDGQSIWILQSSTLSRLLRNVQK